MKKIIGWMLGLCAALSVHAGEQATMFRVRPAIVLQSPLQSDSVNFNGEKFTLKQLLQTKVNMDFNAHAYSRIAIWEQTLRDM